MKRLIVIVYLLLNGCIIYCQSQPFHIESLSAEMGLSQNTVTCIFQDSRGYLWIGTQNGLNRYDGYSIKVYKRNFNNENCISNNGINSIYEDNGKKLWIATNNGLNMFDPDSGIFKQFVVSENDSNTLSGNFIRDVCQDRQGNYWIATRGRGLDMYDARLGRFRNYRNDPKNLRSLSSNALTSVCIDVSGNLWIGTWGGGLNKFNTADQSFVTFRHHPQYVNSIASDYIVKLYSDSLGNIWITTQNGLSKLDTQTNTFQSYKYTSNKYDSMVFSLLPDINGKLWLGTSDGLIRYDSEKQGNETKYLINSQGAGSQEITCLFRDRSGIIWMGTSRSGIMRITPQKFKTYRYDAVRNPGFSNNNIWSFAENPDGNIWVGTDDGVFYFEPKKELITRKFNSIFQSLSSSAISVNALHVDGGTLWAGTPVGLLEINLNTEQFVQHLTNRNDSTSLRSNFVLSLEKADDGNLWIGTSTGLNWMDAKSKTIKQLDTEFDTSTRAPNYPVLSLKKDSKGFIWAGTMNGLIRYSAREKVHFFKEKVSELKSTTAYSCLSICEDGTGRLWIGTDAGISVLNPIDSSLRHIDEVNGLPDNMIYGVLMDEGSNLWISSNRGLSRIDRNNLEKITIAENTKALRLSVKHYDKRDGLQGNEFNSGAFLLTHSQEMYFGGLNGFSRFNPNHIEKNSTAPPVSITSVKKYEKEIKADWTRETGIELLHDENMLTFEFIALDFTDPAKNQYAYKLAGVDNDWVYSNSRRYATYSNLGAGTYRFLVKASNNDLVWSEAVMLNIFIHPPYWKTWWFFCLGVILISSTVWMAHKYRVKQKIKTTLEIERIRRLENERVRKKASDDFHDEFGHTLTKIAMLAEVLKRELSDISEENMTTLQKIIETSKMLSTGMRDFLWVLNPDKDTFREVAIRIKDFGDELFDQTGTDFLVDSIPESYEAYRLSMHTRRHIILIFKEAMHNVLKHAGSRKITLTYQIENNNFVILLADDGKGFNHDEKISGLGIRSMRRRANEIPATLNINSKPDEGTTVQFILPISSTLNQF
ncbi:hypothetical protein JNL27_04610 [bacterium]|nr:hypothetical protein [bacterium]